MKKILFLIPAMITAGIIIGCNSDKTELSFTNSDQSDNSINEIVWEDNTTWIKDGGWGLGASTDSKEVSATKGEVQCKLWNSTNSDWETASVSHIVNGETVAGGALVLDKGSSNNFTLYVR